MADESNNESNNEGNNEGSNAAKANNAVANNKAAQKLGGLLSPGYEEALCGCFEDVPGCIVTCICPACPAAVMSAAHDDRECTTCDCLMPVPLYQLRQRTRAKHGIEMNPLMDCIGICLCGSCAMCQEVREFKKRSGKDIPYFKIPPERMM